MNTDRCRREIGLPNEVYRPLNIATWRRLRNTLKICIGAGVLLACLAAVSEDTQWMVEKVGRGISSGMALDSMQNVHVTFLGRDSKIYYAFRSAATGKWFTISVLESTHSIQNIYPRIAVDAAGIPHLCVATGEMKYITLTGGQWITQNIAPGSGTLSYHCSVALGSDGTPHLSWYHEVLPSGKQFSRLRHADMEDGVWVARSVDGGISGKWNSMVVDGSGNPHLSYSQWAYGGDLRYAEWKDGNWLITDVDSSHNSSTARGYDNSLALGSDGSPHISYFDDTTLKYAHKKDGKWVVEPVARVTAGYDYYAGSTTMLLDEHGAPHIVFGDFGAVKHAFRNGDKWETETIISGGAQQYPTVDAAIGPNDTLYVTYPDPQDGFVKVAIGKFASHADDTAIAAKPKTQE